MNRNKIIFWIYAVCFPIGMIKLLGNMIEKEVKYGKKRT